MKRALRVLQIEDNETDAELLLRELNRAGYDPVSLRVDTLPTLKEALEENWDVILCDFRMPKLNALMALDLVRSRQIDTPFIIVSGTVGEEHAVAALRSGAQDFVLKDRLTRLIPAIERELRDSETRIKRALAESTLRATEASFRTAFELIPDGILACREGLIVHGNRSAASMLGAHRQRDLIDRSLVDLFASTDQDAVRERLQETLRSHEPVAFGELAMVRLDGARISVEATATSVLFEGEPTILVVVRDISARRELIARSMQVDRMLAVGTLAAGVGHEINNPLAYVTANIAYVSEQVVRTNQELEKIAEREPSVHARLIELSEVVTVLSEIAEGADRIRDIARDLRTFARNDEELRPVDVRAVADSALRMAAPEVRQRARVVREYQAVPLVRASESRVSQVFLNLLINAAHAIEKGSYESNEIAVRIRCERETVVVEVIDTGGGISPEHLDRLFTPFFTTKPIGQGTGLGLSISRRIVRSLGGDIVVSSMLGRGTTVRVSLPAFGEPAAKRATPSRMPPPRARVLFIDDERLVGTSFQRAFSREHEVVVVESATDALKLLTGAEKFDAIFCDINMPVMSGLDFYERVEEAMPTLAARIVMITGGMHDPRTMQFVASQRTPVLEKPLDVEQVRMVLGQILGGAVAGADGA